MLLGYGDEVNQAMLEAELYHYVEQDTTEEEVQQAPKEAQSAPEETQGTTGVSDEELTILF